MPSENTRSTKSTEELKTMLAKSRGVPGYESRVKDIEAELELRKTEEGENGA